jgi:hypothetical protein
MYQMATKCTKWPQNVPNGHKMFQMATKCSKWPQNVPNGHKMYIPFGRKIGKMAIKNTNIFQNLPKWGFLVRKYTIWQHWPARLQPLRGRLFDQWVLSYLSIHLFVFVLKFLSHFHLSRGRCYDHYFSVLYVRHMALEIGTKFPKQMF